MKIETKAVHAGDRRKGPSQIPVTTPMYSAASFVADSAEELDRILGTEEPGYCYSRYDSPTNAALEELIRELEGGAAALACASGMSALQIALTAALVDRRKSVVAAEALYGATIKLLLDVMAPFGVEVRFVDFCDLAAVEKAIAEARPGCVLMETISNPLLRVGRMAEVARLARAAGAAVLVDNTFATPMMLRPMEHGAHMAVHSATKYLSGHGDVLGGLVVCDREHGEVVRSLSRTYGPVLGPFEAYMTMRGIKTFPLRFERQCANACRVAQWLSGHPRVERVHFPGDPLHADAATISAQFPKGMYGAMVSFEVKGAAKADIFALMDRLKLVVRATSLGDVHTMVLYPLIASHRNLSPKQLQRMGISENLLRLSVGIEAAEDIIADLEQALAV
ncbi:MAG: PLP-dependent aspartate aminotransferase family protein [Bryobacteraceae bacterium]|nr:PLP-dependent aspartate aminotransferase family protein [Bryobacteraceae bacterium]